MKDGLHQRNGFTLVELLVVISIIAIIAGLVVPALLGGREEAWKAQCTNNLRQIGIAALAYASKHYEFPRDRTDEPTAHDSLNILLKSRHGKTLPALLFKCPAGEAVEARKHEDENYLQLDEDMLDYAWANIRRRPTGKPRPLAACSHHEGVLLVLFTDTALVEWDLNDPAIKAMLDPETGLPEGLGR